MIITTAQEEDIEQLIQLRDAYIDSEYGSIEPEDRSAIHDQLSHYFAEHLNKDLFAFIAKDGETIAATAWLLEINKPANPDFINGKVGEVLNVYTRPDYRKQGLAKQVVGALIARSHDDGLSYVQLEATQAGYPLYKKLGFTEYVPKLTPMIYR